jgi:hypothetical protein
MEQAWRRTRGQPRAGGHESGPITRTNAQSTQTYDWRRGLRRTVTIVTGGGGQKQGFSLAVHVSRPA